jgi:hypothetical protein
MRGRIKKKFKEETETEMESEKIGEYKNKK